MSNISPDQWGDASLFQSVEVNDLVTFAGHAWRVTGVYLGAEKQESVATLVCLDRKPNSVTKAGDCVVPLPFLYGRIYRYVPPNKHKSAEPQQ